MKKILFPTEFSDHAPEIFKFAVELAYFFKARLVLLSAFEKPNFEDTSKELQEHQVDLLTDQMIAFMNENLPEEYKGSLVIDYLIQMGDPPDVILQTALEEEVDLIIMGVTGKNNVIDRLFGTTSHKVLAKAECPVLAIPATAKFEGIDNIVYTTDFEFRDLAAINYLKKWSKVFQAPIHCLHIYKDKEEERRAKQSLEILTKTFEGNKRITCDIMQGYFKNDIEKFAKSKKTDIITMMSHKRKSIGRLITDKTIKGVIQHLNIPILLIKDNS